MAQPMRNLLTTLAAAILAAVTISTPVFAADKPAQRAAPIFPKLGIGDLSDAMNPMNPFNGGVEPMAMPGDSRLVVFTYNPDQIYKVLSAPLKTTTIEFPPGETLASEPALGESVRWNMETDGANHIYVRPHASGLVNTLSVNTTKRSYEFTLVSSPLGGIFYQKVRFQVPESLMTKVKARADLVEKGGDDAGRAEGLPADAQSGRSDMAVSPDKLNFDYSVGGRADFKPENVFDDGRAVWMRIPKSADWPIALVKDGKDYVVTNFIRRGDFLVVQRLADIIMLRSGDAEVTVQRGKRGFLGLF